MARHQLQTRTAAALPPTIPAAPPAVAQPEGEPAPAAPARTAPAADAAAPIPHATPSARPPQRHSLPVLPPAVRQSRSLSQLQTALKRQIDSDTNHSLPLLPATPPLPPTDMPLLPRFPAVDQAELRAAVARLDAHLARKAPFLRRLYAHDLALLDQLRRLDGGPTAPAAPPAADPALPASAPALAAPRPDRPAYCPVGLPPAVCPAG